MSKKQKERKPLHGGKIPKDYHLAHNHIAHTVNMTHGLNGFRRFWIPPEWKWVKCRCGWRPDLGPHYRHPGTSDKTFTWEEILEKIVADREIRKIIADAVND
jgi:hypothetical protein